MSAAAELRAAAQKLRDAVADDTAVALHPEAVRAIAAWLEVTDSGLSFWAPYREHEPDYGMWAAALEVARAIGGQP